MRLRNAAVSKIGAVVLEIDWEVQHENGITAIAILAFMRPAAATKPKGRGPKVKVDLRYANADPQEYNGYSRVTLHLVYKQSLHVQRAEERALLATGWKRDDWFEVTSRDVCGTFIDMGHP